MANDGGKKYNIYLKKKKIARKCNFKSIATTNNISLALSCLRHDDEKTSFSSKENIIFIPNY